MVSWEIARVPVQAQQSRGTRWWAHLSCLIGAVPGLFPVSLVPPLRGHRNNGQLALASASVFQPSAVI